MSFFQDTRIYGALYFVLTVGFTYFYTAFTFKPDETAEQLRKGLNLEGALGQMLRDLDGSYSCLVATERQLGFVKDTFALKPLVMTETDDFVAVATEEIAIRAALPGTYSVREAQVKEVRVWQK